MREDINIVSINKKIPLSFSIIHFDHILRHMHASVQLLIFFNGKCRLQIENDVFDAQENDMVIINPRTFHEIIANQDAVVLSVLIDQYDFGLEPMEADTLAFNLNSILIKENPRYDSIRHLIYSIIKFNSMANVNSIYTNRAIAYSLFAQLMNDFQKDVKESKQLIANYDTITKITSYVGDHYQEKLSLSFLAQHFGYTVAYLSRLFKQSIGVTFIEYYDKLRVDHSIDTLIISNMSIEEIALQHGFENSRSYVRAFLHQFKIYPSEYRKNNKKSFKKTDLVLTSTLKKEILDKIFSFYESYNQSHHNSTEKTRDTESLISIDYQLKPILLDRPQTKTLHIPKSLYILSSDTQKQLIDLQNDVHFETILLTSLFDEDFKLIHEQDNAFILNFITLDKVLFFLQSINLTPHLRFEIPFLSFKINQYFAVFKKILQHLQNWIFPLPLFISVTHAESSISFTEQRYEDFLKQYDLFFYETKKLLPNAQIGTPLFCKETIVSTSHFEHFLSHCKQSFIEHDFYAIHFLSKKSDKSILLENKDELKDFLSFLKEKQLFIENKMQIENLDFALTTTCLLHDTLYASSFLTKNLIDNIKSLWSISKPIFSDEQDLTATSQYFFQGKSGLFTYNSIKKSSYYAYLFFSKLGNELLKKSQNYIVTKQNNRLIILVNNYNHYSDLYAQQEYYELTNEDRYSCFPKSTNIHFHFIIESVPFTCAKIKTSILTKDSGSAYDLWLAIGAPEQLNSDELSRFQHMTEPKFEIHYKTIVSSSLKIELSIAPLETKLIEIDLS